MTTIIGNARFRDSVAARLVRAIRPAGTVADSVVPDQTGTPPGDYAIQVDTRELVLQAHAFDPENLRGPWRASTVYAVGDVIFETATDENSLVLECTAVTGSEESGASEPTWDSNVGNTTTDNDVTWETLGTLAELTPITQYFYQPVLLTAVSPNYGDIDGGTTLTGTGAGLSGFDAAAGDTITVGGNNVANITIISDTEFTGDAPASSGGASGLVDVVITIGGESITLEDGFRYIWTPAQIATELWLDASDADTITLDGSGNVVQWNDKSGNDRHLLDVGSAWRPAYTLEHQNGRNVVTLNDSSMDWSATSLAADDWQFFIAHEQTAVSKSSALGYFMDSTTDRFIVASHYDSGAPFDESAFYDGAWTKMAPNTLGGQLLHYELDSDARLLRNGTEVAAPGGYSQKPIGGTVKWFSANTSGANFALGRMWEIILIKGSISESIRQKLEGYSAFVWGTQAKLEAGHPYKESPP